MGNKGKSISFRLDESLEKSVQEWLDKNGVTSSQLCNLAIRNFITRDHNQTLEKVELQEPASLPVTISTDSKDSQYEKA